ncbi:Uncharacterized protein QJS10_CPA03g00176 [Acorus calamus]|uniref:Uncharacterized protein n=1 Tax=Acorus calamus TaxID=4465 RepID=A0AAV9F4N9_ACOCL|nr:Uncharacterized protein QJS10_CPA03g00176 [Acorus calamus]
MQENMAYLSNLDQLEALSQKLKARTMRAEAPTQSIAATRTMTRTILLLAILITITDWTVSNPQTNLLNIGCSQYNASNPADFISKLNQTSSDLRSQINHASTRFATAQQPRVKY